MDAQNDKIQEIPDKLKAEMEEALAQVHDPTLKKICTESFTRIMAGTSKEVESAPNKLKKKIVSLPQQEEQMVLAFIPHEMAKVSIFFPMSDKELKTDRRLIHQCLLHKTNWGEVKIEGIRLAIIEEDIFLALMKIAKNNILREGNQFLLKTSIKEIAGLLYENTGYSTTKVSEMLLRTLKHFQLVRFEIALFDKKSTDGMRKRADGMLGSIGNIVESFYYMPETHELSIYFNPHFYLFFMGSMLTNINFSLRRKLKKDGSKALLRFFSTHTDPGPMHIFTVLNAINFKTHDEEKKLVQPKFKFRQMLKSFIRELKLHGILGPKTKLSNDIVYFDVIGHQKVLEDTTP